MILAQLIFSSFTVALLFLLTTFFTFYCIIKGANGVTNKTKLELGSAEEIQSLPLKVTSSVPNPTGEGETQARRETVSMYAKLVYTFKCRMSCEHSFI